MIVGERAARAEVARHYVEGGRRRPSPTARKKLLVAKEFAGRPRAVFDLTEPSTIGPAVAGVGPVDHLVLARSLATRTRREYDPESAERLSTMKLVGYTATVHALLPGLHDESSVVLFGGRAKDRPYPGSVTVTSVNGAMSSMIRALATELKPIRFNAIHPGIVGDSPYWAAKPEALQATAPAIRGTGCLVTMADIVDAVRFLLENRGERHQPLRGRWLAADVEPAATPPRFT
jgi:NADP-dependent 3-hydroxy acid dehydrogenase YdfG